MQEGGVLGVRSTYMQTLTTSITFLLGEKDSLCLICKTGIVPVGLKGDHGCKELSTEPGTQDAHEKRVLPRLFPLQTHNAHLHIKYTMEAGSMFRFKSPMPDKEEACIKYALSDRTALSERTAAHPALPTRDFLHPL